MLDELHLPDPFFLLLVATRFAAATYHRRGHGSGRKDALLVRWMHAGWSNKKQQNNTKHPKRMVEMRSSQFRKYLKKESSSKKSV